MNDHPEEHTYAGPLESRPLPTIEMTEEVQEVHACIACGSPNAPFRCNSCHAAWFCTKQCQRVNWMAHKISICGPVQTWISSVETQYGAKFVRPAKLSEFTMPDPSDCKDEILIAHYCFRLRSGKEHIMRVRLRLKPPAGSA